MILRRKVILLQLILISILSRAQQTILPLTGNNELKAFLSLHPDIDKSYGLKSLNKTNAAFDSLPFFEDFTTSNIVTDTNKWVDRNVFINNGFPISPPSYNVATFDGLDKDGNAYNLSTFLGYGPADTLTSVPLNFSSYSASNNIYFSFFYEMGGFGDPPQPEDSLLLQFLTFGGKWNTIWVKAGGGTNETQFTQVLLPINNALYFHGAFQFRFINYASHTGNWNQWLVDYILIDRNRSASDSLYSDVTIMTTPTPLLSRYYRMPWNQYKGNPAIEKASATSFYVRNLKNTNVQVPSKYFTFNKQYNNLISSTSFILGSLTHQSPQKISYSNTTILFDSILPVNDFVDVRCLYTASENSDVRRANDSIYKEQIFSNYYSYDDGTAEAGYGIAFGAGKVALGFETNIADTLRAIDIYFNQSGTTNAGINFTLAVWKSLSPEVKLYTQTVLVPQHDYSYYGPMGGFTRFLLDTARYIAPGKFFIGWMQSSTYMLNVGLDMNYPDNFGVKFNPNMFYNTGSWLVSGFPGTVMMRPVLGKPVIVGIENKEKKLYHSLHIYPNPAHSILNIDLPINKMNEITIINMNGKVVKQLPMLNSAIDVHDLTSGIYILNIFDPVLNQTYSSKFVIQ